MFAEIAAWEGNSATAIQRRASVVALADRDAPYTAALANPALAALASGADLTLPVTERPRALPAFGETAGPS